MTATNLTFQDGLKGFVQHYSKKWDDAQKRVEQSADICTLSVSSSSALREEAGNHPKVLHHDEPRKHVAVLIHGITDSPHYMEAIGRRLFSAGINVILPLLPAHASKRPHRAMRELRYTDWIHDVDAMVSIAKKLGNRVSLGGFSTGGALSVHKLTRDPEAITGGVFLFSAALDIGDIGQSLLSSPAGSLLGRIIDDKKFLGAKAKERIAMFKNARKEATEPEDDAYGIGENPYKYSVFFVEGASELAEVIEEIDDYYEKRNIKPYSDIRQPLFVAHSKTDDAARYEGAQLVVENHPDARKQLYTIEKLPHASVVLERAITAGPDPSQHAPQNPEFSTMTTEMLKFVDSYLS